ncbi:putative membrane protein [Weissella sp. DD23]|nr:putative membrane protein [Weissella sp. DD23]
MKRLSGVSLGVYVIHEFVIAVLEKLLHLDQSSYYHMLALPMVVWVISVAIVLGLQKIPGVNRLLP